MIVSDNKIKNLNQKNPCKILLDSKFIFDDHIRCMAAKQRLNKVLFIKIFVI